MRHSPLVLFLTVQIIFVVTPCIHVLAQEAETVLQASGSARFDESDYEGSRQRAVEAARWNAVKIILGDYIKASAEDDETMAPIRAAVEKQITDYLLAETVMSEEISNGLLHVTVRVKLNERRLVNDVNRLLGSRSGGSVKPRLLLLLDDRTDGIFSSSVAEQFNSRGLFDIKDIDVLGDVAAAKIRKKMNDGTLEVADIEAIQIGQMASNDLDFIVAGEAVATLRGGDGRPEASITISGLRVIDLGTARIVATVTDSVVATGGDMNVAVSNVAVKAARLLTPRIIDQLIARWSEMLVVTLEVDNLSWYSPDGSRFSEKVMKACELCRGRTERSQNKERQTGRVRVAYIGDLFEFVESIQALARKAGFPSVHVVDVDEASGLVHLSLGL